MSARWQVLATVILVAVLMTGLAGCRSSECSGGPTLTGAPPQGPMLAGNNAQEEGGFLMRTGAMQLGPGTQKNQWGWQGDGHSGFMTVGSQSPAPPLAGGEGQF